MGFRCRSWVKTSFQVIQSLLIASAMPLPNFLYARMHTHKQNGSLGKDAPSQVQPESNPETLVMEGEQTPSSCPVSVYTHAVDCAISLTRTHSCSLSYTYTVGVISKTLDDFWSFAKDFQSHTDRHATILSGPDDTEDSFTWIHEPLCL